MEEEEGAGDVEAAPQLRSRGDEDQEVQVGAVGHLGGARERRWPRDLGVHGDGSVLGGESARGRGSERRVDLGEVEGRSPRGRDGASLSLQRRGWRGGQAAMAPCNDTRRRSSARVGEKEKVGWFGEMGRGPGGQGMPFHFIFILLLCFLISFLYF